MDYVVSYSGGLGSFCAAYRLKQSVPPSRIRLVFCDTLVEDDDLYRFLDESALKLGLELIKLKDGRHPWQVFADVRLQGNSRIAPCSRVLKRDVFNQWLADNYQKQDGKYQGVTVVMGIDYEEAERLERAKANNPDQDIIAPLCDSPYIGRKEREAILADLNIEMPRLYSIGFPHNNCGGFCVRSGLAQFDLLRRSFPDRFKWHKEQQQALSAAVPSANRPFLRKTINGKLNYITLAEFEEMKLSESEQLDFGGCGCFIDDEMGD